MLAWLIALFSIKKCGSQGISPQPFPAAGIIPVIPANQTAGNAVNEASFANTIMVGEEVISNSTSLASVQIPLPSPPLPPPNPQGSIQVICPP